MSPGRNNATQRLDRSRRKPTGADVATARQLRDLGPTKVTHILHEDGVQVHVRTVARWLDQDQAERRRIAQRASERAARASRTRPRSHVSDEHVIARMRAWRAAGAAWASIALIAREEFGRSWDRERVRDLVKETHRV